MFPIGAVGIALLVVRLSIAALLLLVAYSRAYAFPLWELVIVYCVVTSLGLGFYTPVSSVVCAFVELGQLPTSTGDNTLQLIIYVLLSLSMAVFGPGGYSIDARLFGRRLIDPETLQRL